MVRVVLLALLLSGCFARLDENKLTAGSRSDAGATTSDAGGDGAAPGDLAARCDFDAFPVGALPPGWTAASGNWQVVTAAGHHALGQIGTPSARAIAWTGSMATGDLTATATVIPATNTSDCLVVHFVDLGDYDALCIRNGTTYAVVHVSGGSEQNRGGNAFSYAPGTTHTLAVTTRGTSLTASIDGSAVAVMTGQPFFDHGAVGVATEADSSFPSVCVSVP